MEYNKKTKMGINIFPGSQLLNSPLEPYNTIFSIRNIIGHLDQSFVFENEKLYDIYTDILMVKSPTFSKLNCLLVQDISNLTAPIRFKDCLTANINQFEINYVPYPRLHLLLPSYAPKPKSLLHNTHYIHYNIDKLHRLHLILIMY